MHCACDTEGDTQPDENFSLLVEELRGVARTISQADWLLLPNVCRRERNRLIHLIDRISSSLVPDDAGTNHLANDDEWRSKQRVADATLFNNQIRLEFSQNCGRARKEELFLAKLCQSTCIFKLCL